MQCGSVSESDQDQEIVTIAHEIYDYLAAHPQATDSLGGVVKWWLARQRLESATDCVQKALDHLVAQGLVSRRVIPGGQVVYFSPKGHESHES